MVHGRRRVGDRGVGLRAGGGRATDPERAGDEREHGTGIRLLWIRGGRAKRIDRRARDVRDRDRGRGKGGIAEG